MEDIITKDGPLDPNKVYRVALKGFLYEAKDGYECFKEGILESIYDDESGDSVHHIIYNFFASFRVHCDPKLKDRKRDLRLSLFDTNEKNVDGNGFIKIRAPND